MLGFNSREVVTTEVTHISDQEARRSSLLPRQAAWHPDDLLIVGVGLNDLGGSLPTQDML